VYIRFSVDFLYCISRKCS